MARTCLCCNGETVAQVRAWGQLVKSQTRKVLVPVWGQQGAAMPMPKGAQGNSTCHHLLVPARAKLWHKTFPGVPSALPAPARAHTSLPCCVATHHLPGAGGSPGAAAPWGGQRVPAGCRLPSRGRSHCCFAPSKKAPGHHFGLLAAPMAEPPWPGALPQAANSSWGQGWAAQSRAGGKASEHLPTVLEQLSPPHTPSDTLRLGDIQALSKPSFRLEVSIFPSLAVALQSAAKDRIHPQCQFDLRFTAQAPKSSAACEVL